jgi:hypothetical protein
MRLAGKPDGPMVTACRPERKDHGITMRIQPRRTGRIPRRLTTPRRGSTGRTPGQASRSAAAAAIAGAAVLAGVTACGTTTPSANPLAGLTAGQIAARAITDLKAASSVHFAGSVTDSGAAYAVDVTAGTTDCAGTLGIPGQGSVALLKIGQRLWIKPDDQFWASTGASPANLHLAEGKYVQASPGDPDFSAVQMLCSPAQFADSLGNQMKYLVKGATTTIDGHSALQLRDTSTAGSAYVTISASPEFLRLDAQAGGSTGQLDFSDYDAPVTLTPPPASQTIDGSTIGL